MCNKRIKGARLAFSQIHIFAKHIGPGPFNSPTRQQLEPVKDAVIKLVERMKLRGKLTSAAVNISTISITNKMKALTNLAVSEELQRHLNEEFSALGLSYISATFQSTGSAGKIFHKLRLNLPSASDSSKVLSEGEQRILAISSFLAEVSLSDGDSGIVLDDPVSSLDHKYRERVAKRLVAEADARPVTIFTHDLYFLALLQSECGAQQVPLYCQTLNRIGDSAGLVANDLPFEGLSTSKRITYLLALADDLRSKQSSISASETWMRLKFGYEQLRESWEYAVEEVLLANVVGRFVPDIQTNRLNAVLVEDADYLEVDAAMSKCSQSTHAKPPAAGSASLTVDDFELDVRALEAFRKRVQARNTATTATRKASLKPPAA